MRIITCCIVGTGLRVLLWAAVRAVGGGLERHPFLAPPEHSSTLHLEGLFLSRVVGVSAYETGAAHSPPLLLALSLPSLTALTHAQGLSRGVEPGSHSHG